MSSISSTSPADRRLILALIVILTGYAAGLSQGWPQRATTGIVTQQQSLAQEAVTEHPAAGGHPPLWMIAPFALLLGGIAFLPLLPQLSHWWESNLHKFYLASSLAILALAYYLLLHRHPVALHWPVESVVGPHPSGWNGRIAGAVLVNAFCAEYIPFMVLLLSLYTISGGIHIEGELAAYPGTNAAILATGAVLASFIGTTGAAMLMVRPLLETNRTRRHVCHTIVFFIFVAGNCGGLLLPLGDPPLFLGYLMGVPFFWTLKFWPEWLFINGTLIAIYYLCDRYWFFPREVPAALDRGEPLARRLRIRGVWPNALLLLGVIVSIAVLDPAKPVWGTAWYPWLYLREAVQLLLVLISLLGSPRGVRRANQFGYHAIVEVAVLFAGIFVCMQPALQILHVEGPALGLVTPRQFFWACGGLSAVLDNAPTYVVFFQTARSVGGVPAVAGVPEALLLGLSLGAVCLGALTYIGNGPNFLVKSIAEQAGIAMPSFFGYMVYSGLVLLPLLFLTTRLFVH